MTSEVVLSIESIKENELYIGHINYKQINSFMPGECRDCSLVWKDKVL